MRSKGAPTGLPLEQPGRPRSLDIARLGAGTDGSTADVDTHLHGGHGGQHVGATGVVLTANAAPRSSCGARFSKPVNLPATTRSSGLGTR